MKLVTFCIPSRNRPRGLHETIESLYETAKPDDFDIVVRLDSDDERGVAAIPSFAKYANLRWIIGPRCQNSYHGLGDCVTEASKLANTPWVSFIDDDMLILGKGWIEQLAKLPTEGHIAHCEFYWLGATPYGSGSCGPVGPFVPTRCWEKLGHNRIVHPHDDFLHQMAMRAGWQYSLLKQITLKHEWRKSDDDKRPVH